MAGRITMENVDQVFGAVVPSEEVIPAIKLVTERFTEMARTIITNVPDCAHRSAALRDLLVAKWTSVDAIIKGGLV